MSAGQTTDIRRINLEWLYRLRWSASLGQAVVIVAATLTLNLTLPLIPLFGAISVAMASNLWLRQRLLAKNDLPSWLTPAIIVLDIVILTILLYLSGGPSNPFNFLYVVNIVLAAVLLEPKWTWGLVALSMVCLASLFVDHLPLGGPGANHALHMKLHTQGMWVALGVAAFFIVYFVDRINRSLREREGELTRVRAQKVRTDQLASLATLAAGAAHELSTPLSTIALVAGELERDITKASMAQDMIDDAKLIRSQVERCRLILNQMSIETGQALGEAHATTSVQELIDDTIDNVSAPERVAVTLNPSLAKAEIEVPRHAVSQALRALIQNALEASEAVVSVVVKGTDNRVEVTIADEGQGMAPDVLARVGEPFFTTKEPGKGTGLGLYLAREVLERIGGDLQLSSDLGAGTTVAVRLPRKRATKPTAMRPNAALA